MTADDTYPDHGQEGTEAKIETTRRSVLAATGALATAANRRWEDLGYHPEDGQDWGNLDGIVERTSLGIEDSLSGTFEGRWGMMRAVSEGFDEETVTVTYHGERVSLGFDGDGDDAYLGATAKLNPDQAREVAIGLWMAADELEAFGE